MVDILITLPDSGSANWDGPLNTALTALRDALLTAAVDAEVVHLAGEETITGDKTFTGEVTVPDAAFTIAKVSGLQDALDTATTSGSVSSVNSLTGAVTLTAASVGALPSTATLDDIDDGTTNVAYTAAERTKLFDLPFASTLGESVRDAVATALIPGAGVTITVNDIGDTITITASGVDGMAWLRETATYTSVGLADGAHDKGLITMGRAYKLYAIDDGGIPTRIRLYATIAQQDADESRVISIPPSSSSGVMFDFLSDGTGFQVLPPMMEGVNFESGLDVPITVTNEVGFTADVSVTLTFRRTE